MKNHPMHDKKTNKLKLTAIHQPLINNNPTVTRTSQTGHKSKTNNIAIGDIIYILTLRTR
jgi:hypothetical protein